MLNLSTVRPAGLVWDSILASIDKVSDVDEVDNLLIRLFIKKGSRPKNGNNQIRNF